MKKRKIRKHASIEVDEILISGDIKTLDELIEKIKDHALRDKDLDLRLKHLLIFRNCNFLFK